MIARRCSFNVYLFSLGTWLVACGDDASPVAQHADAAAVSQPDAALEVDAGCLENSLQSCQCESGGSGTRVCHDGLFGACQGCSTSTSGGSKCAAGRYEGSFIMPKYRSGPAGICGVIAQLQDDVAEGRWDFSLMQTGTPEFYEVGGGCLSAGGTEHTKAVKATIEGSVDCGTGKLSGTLKGTYRSTSVCSLGISEDDYFFKGTLSGTYDPATGSFVDTYVQWNEPAVAIPPQPGGEGTWQATLNPDADIVTDVDCLDGVAFRDDLFPAAP